MTQVKQGETFQCGVCDGVFLLEDEAYGSTCIGCYSDYDDAPDHDHEGEAVEESVDAISA